MTKIVAYCAILYGADYLASAIRSVIDAVDEMHFIYDATQHGSHGHHTDLTCPDKREDLIAIAWEAAKGKMTWNQGYFAHEGEQRMSIHRYAPDADVILVLDADEIYPDITPLYPLGLRNYLESLTHQGEIRTFRWPMIHAWRSFYRAVLHDPAYPTRVIVPGGTRVRDSVVPCWKGQMLPIVHMGYAQRSEIVKFKQYTHGHRGEWRTDCDWFRDRFMANAQVDCHPVGSQFWNPEPINPWDYLPAWMKEHAYAKLDVIP